MAESWHEAQALNRYIRDGGDAPSKHWARARVALADLAAAKGGSPLDLFRAGIWQAREEARMARDTADAIAFDRSWRTWPLALKAEVELVTGDESREALERAYIWLREHERVRFGDQVLASYDVESGGTRRPFVIRVRDVLGRLYRPGRGASGRSTTYNPRRLLMTFFVETLGLPATTCAPELTRDVLRWYKLEDCPPSAERIKREWQEARSRDKAPASKPRA